jgi:hypothetical protein
MMYKLGDVVDAYLQAQGLPDNMWNRCYTMGTDCLVEVGMDISSIPKPVELPLNEADNTCDLPCDFLNYINIGIVGWDGTIFGMGRNNDINLTKYYNNCGAPAMPPVPNLTVGQLGNIWGNMGNPTYLANHWRNGENTGGYFNVGGHNTIGGYNINYNTNQIVFQGLRFPNVKSIHLEYIADIDAQGNDYLVHPFLLETVKAWIYWKYIQRDRNYGIGEKQLAENAFLRARKKSVHRFTNGTAQEWLDSMRKQNAAIPKF